MKWFQKPRGRGKRGATMVEYILIVALVAIVLIAAWRYFAGKAGKALRDEADTIGNVVGESIQEGTKK